MLYFVSVFIFTFIFIVHAFDVIFIYIIVIITIIVRSGSKVKALSTLTTIVYSRRFQLVADLLAARPTSPQQVVVMDLGNDTTQQTQRTFAGANLLQTCRLCCGLLLLLGGELLTES